MPGANYMGGKRNAAKARSKDSTGRIQKGFFSKRRLDMLSQGLAPNRGDHGAPVYAGTREAGRSDIGLAHAKHRLESRQDVVGFIPSPTRFSPRTPNSRKSSKRFNQTGSSSNSTQSSKVIEALDISEPLFIRATMDRILTLPDLAGLTGRCARPAAPTTSTGYKRPMPYGGREREKGPSSSTKKHKKQRTSSYENENFASGSSLLGQGRVDHVKEEHNLTSNGSPNISHTSFSPFQPIVNQMDLDVAQEEFWSLDIDDDDVGYSDFRAGLDGDDGTFDGEARATSSPKKGFKIVSSSGPLSSPCFGGRYSSPGYMNSRLPSPRTPDLRLAGGHAQSLGSLLGGSSTPKTEDIPGRTTHRFTSNNLFDHDDPWHTIGVILGLSPTSQTGDSTNNLDSEAIAIKSSTKSPVMMSMTYEMSLPPSSPPADYSTPPKYHIPDHLTSSPELYELFPLENDDTVLSTCASNSSLVGSPSVSATHFPSSPRLSPTRSWSPLAKAPLATNHGSSPDVTGDPSTSFAPTMIRNNNNNSSDTDHIHSDSNDFGSGSNDASTPSSQSSTNRVNVLNNHGTPNDTKSYSATALSLTSCPPPPSYPGTFCATPTRSTPKLELVDPLSTIAPRAPQARSSSVTGKAPPVDVLDQESLQETSVTSSNSSKHSASFSLRLTEVNGVFQGPCLFPEGSELDSDESES